MSDLEKLKALLDDFGVGYKTKSTEDGGTCIECAEGHEKVSGYSGFFTNFYFDRDGKFVDMGAWE